jgi:uncharacterized protein (DUF2147 family)
MRNAKTTSRVAFVLLIGFSTGAAAFAAAAPTGEWAREDGLVRARVTRCGSNICATNTWTRDPNSVEKPGDRFIMSVRAANPGHWTGSAFDPQRKINFTVDLQIEGNRLTTRGCISGSTVCNSFAWTRIRN